MTGAAPTFWDRRRAAVQAEAEADQRAIALQQADEAEAQLDAESDDAVLARLNLPAPESLSMGDDFTAFMAKGVPTRLRNRALRRLWRSNPVLACVDGLNDYDADYLTGSTGNGVIASTYQVGKGLLAHLQKLERQSETTTAPDTAEIFVDAPDETALALAEPDAPVTEPDTPEERAPAPRRMRFRFDAEARA